MVPSIHDAHGPLLRAGCRAVRWCARGEDGVPRTVASAPPRPPPRRRRDTRRRRRTRRSRSSARRTGSPSATSTADRARSACPAWTGRCARGPSPRPLRPRAGRVAAPGRPPVVARRRRCRLARTDDADGPRACSAWFSSADWLPAFLAYSDAVIRRSQPHQFRRNRTHEGPSGCTLVSLNSFQGGTRGHDCDQRAGEGQAFRHGTPGRVRRGDSRPAPRGRRAAASRSDGQAGRPRGGEHAAACGARHRQRPRPGARGAS